MCVGHIRSGLRKMGIEAEDMRGKRRLGFATCFHQHSVEMCLCTSVMPATPAAAFCWRFRLSRWLDRRNGLMIRVFRLVFRTTAATSRVQACVALLHLGHFVVLHRCLRFQGSPSRRLAAQSITTQVTVFLLPSVTLKEHSPQSWLATKSADASMTSPEMSSGTMNSWIPSPCICHPSFHVPFQAAINGLLKSHRPMLVVDPCGRQLNAHHRHFRRRPGLRFQRNRCRQCPRWRRCHSPQ